MNNKINIKIIYLANLILEENGLEDENGILSIPYNRIKLKKDIIYKILNKLDKEKLIEMIDYANYLLKAKKNGLDIDFDDVYKNFVNNNLLIKPNFNKLEVFIKKYKYSANLFGKPYFNKDESKIIWGNSECKVPKNGNEYFVCKVMFKEKFFTKIKEIDILIKIDLLKRDTTKAKRTVYDAMRAVNKRMEKSFKVKQFFEYKNNHIWVNEKYKNILK